ncbi:MAG: ABC transporter permease, partial [Alphaproteobacteria bacterium]|nr:ABC transporter permease [Alphaproteobacteria bacterium]
MVIREKIRIFSKNKRAFWSLVLFGCVFFLSLFSNLIANDKPLIVKYKNQILFP